MVGILYLNKVAFKKIKSVQPFQKKICTYTWEIIPHIINRLSVDGGFKEDFFHFAHLHFQVFLQCKEISYVLEEKNRKPK